MAKRHPSPKRLHARAEIEAFFKMSADLREAYKKVNPHGRDIKEMLQRIDNHISKCPECSKKYAIAKRLVPEKHFRGSKIMGLVDCCHGDLAGDHIAENLDNYQKNMAGWVVYEIEPVRNLAYDMHAKDCPACIALYEKYLQEMILEKKNWKG